MKTKRVALFIVGIIAFFVIACIWFSSGTPAFGKHPALQGGTPEWINVNLLRQQTTISNRSDCERIVSVLSRARFNGPPHACMPLGNITIGYSDGQTNHLGFMASHGWGRFDFMMNGELFAISSRKLRDALGEAGSRTE